MQHGQQASAKQIAEAICANVDAFWARATSYEAFSAQQRRLWNAAEKSGIVERVSALLPVNNAGNPDNFISAGGAS